MLYNAAGKMRKHHYSSPRGKAPNQQSILRNILVHNLFTRQASPGLCSVCFTASVEVFERYFLLYLCLLLSESSKAVYSVQ